MTGLLLALALNAHGAPVTAVPRTVLVLYRKEHIPGTDKDIAFLPVHQHAEAPLNWLGLTTEYIDVDGPLPDAAALKEVRGVLAWMPTTHAVPDPRRLCRWLDGAMRSGIKVVFLAEFGLQRSGAGLGDLDSECRSALKTLGVADYRGYRYVDPLDAKVSAPEPGVIGFERRPDPAENPSASFTTLAPGGTALATVRSEGGVQTNTPVAVTPHGGWALTPFVLYSNQAVHPTRYAWILDPFRFFDRAFALQGLPRPDPTTLNGRRVYTSHVDGDGFFNLSEVDRRLTSGEVYTREFIARRPDSPFTVSVISGYYDLEVYKDPRTAEITRAALVRPNVEPASHGYAHPLVWRTGKAALSIPGYSVSSRGETGDAARLIESRFLPPGRRVGLYLWTGDCLPKAEDAAAAEEAGLLAVNGGGGLFDPTHPSYAYLMPFSRQVGRFRQIYSPTSNENEFTNLWTGPFYGYRDAITTFERSGAPRRLKPVDVYVHFYSAEKFASVQALRSVYDWAYAQPLTPVFFGRYAEAVRDFFAMRVRRLGPGRWRFEGGPRLRTVRFDGAAGEPDLAASKGVLGFKRDLGSLYVHLDGSDVRELAMAPHADPRPRLEDANFEVESWSAGPTGVRFKKTGWWTSECVLAGLSPRARYRVSGAGLDATLPAGADGRLTLRFPGSERGGPAREVSVEALP